MTALADAADAPREALLAGLRELGLALDDAQVARLLELMALVLEWNAKFNLTAIRDPLDFVRKHLLDSLTVQPYLRGPFVIDVGTGAGFPGLPLAIADPALRFTLVDGTGKKIRFVEHAVQTLALANVSALHVRAELHVPEQRATTVVSRALASLDVFVKQAGPLCARSGRLLAMKGRDPSAELRELPRGWRATAVERLRVPGLDDERHLVVLERDG